MKKLSLQHIALPCFLCFIAFSAQAQVASSINEQNLKSSNSQSRSTIKKSAEKSTPATQAVEIDTATIYFHLLDSAQCYIKTKEWHKAEEFIRQAIYSEPSNPNNSLLLSNLGTLQRYQGKYSEAIKNYSMAIDMAPNAITLLGNRAALYLEIDSIALAKADYERIIKIAPEEEEARYNLGMIYLNENNYTAADEQFEEILRYNPESLLSNKGKAFLCKAQGQHAKAVQYFSEIIKVEPTPSILANRADCYLTMQRLAEAAEDINSAIQVDPNDGFLYLLRAKLNKMRYESDASKRDIQLAIEHGIDKDVANEILK